MRRYRSQLRLLIIVCFLFCMGVSSDTALSDNRTPLDPIPDPRGSEPISFSQDNDMQGFVNNHAVYENNLFFTPRYPMTLLYYWFPFYLTDACIGGYDPLSGPFHFIFEGMFFGLMSLNALDIIMFGGGESPEEMLIYFSVRDDHLLHNADGTDFYMHKEDIAVLDTQSGNFQRILEGKAKGVLGIDAVATYEGSCKNPDGTGEIHYIFSPTVDCLLSNGLGNLPVYCQHQDLVEYNPVTETFTIFLRGLEDIGVTSIDGVDIESDKIFISVEQPTLVFNPPTIVYLRDGDIACFDLFDSNGLELYFEGKPKGVTSIDGFAINKVPE